MKNSQQPLQIGPYSIVEHIGTGESSNVFLAMRAGTFATVAIKILRENRQTADYRALLSNEVALAGRLNHKNIVSILEADLEYPQGPYVVMEYVKGVSLDHHQKTEQLLPLKVVLSVVEQIASALKHLSDEGFVHRDVKPENILHMPNGLAKLTDFGCAVPAHVPASVAGSLAYMSPEQLDGWPLDQRADIYSLAATLYRLLTGKNTFEADSSFDAHIAVLNFPAMPVHNYRKGLPRQLVQVIHRALDKDRNQRYPDWDAFINELGNANHAIRMSDFEFDLDMTRGFSPSTQSLLSRRLSATRNLSRSAFSQSMLPN